MPINVQVLPSGREFVSEGHSTLLEAGLRAGLALGYGCSNGNCGECLAKIVSGEVRKVRHHDYRISDHKKAGNHVLMCCNTATTHVVLEAQEAHSSYDISEQKITARVKSIETVNDNVALIHLKTPRTNRLRFLAGQHVNLDIPNVPISSHSVGSCPCDDMNLHFQIPRQPGDLFSEHVFKRLKKGDSINIIGPQGDFILSEDLPNPLVFIAWHTGFAPVRSLVEHAMALEIKQAIHLVWVTGSKQDRYLDNLCRSWEDALDDFLYVPVDANLRNHAIDINSITGRLNIKPADLTDHVFYIAGNQLLLEACEKTLINFGLPAGQLKMDPIEHY